MEISNQFTYLESYNLILIRYNEIWLKSRRVKNRMLKILVNNIKVILNREKIHFHKYQISKDFTRIFFFFKNVDIPSAVNVLHRAFGIYSFSPALRTSSNLKNITERVIEVGEKIFKKGDTFALRVRRSGIHNFSSQDVAVKVGDALRTHFSYLNLKVNLGSPKKKIFIEIRDDFCYIFTDIIKSIWGGLPVERNKKVIAMDISRLNDLIASFLILKRGATIYPILFILTNKSDIFEKRLKNWKEVVKYTPNLKFIVRKINLTNSLNKIINNLENKKFICAICRLFRFELISKILKELNISGFERIRAITDGTNLNNSTLCPDEVDLESISLNYLFSEYPLFTPLIGLNKNQIKDFSLKISKNLEDLDYCQFKPKMQEFDAKKLKEIYKNLNLKDTIQKIIKNIKEINLLQ